MTPVLAYLSVNFQMPLGEQWRCELSSRLTHVIPFFRRKDQKIQNDRMYSKNEQGPVVGKGYGVDSRRKSNNQRSRTRDKDPVFGRIDPVTLLKLIVDKSDRSSQSGESKELKKATQS